MAKRVIAKEMLLAYPNFNEPFQIHTDASHYQLGAVVLQEGKPIAFYSRKLNPAQTRYTTTERELLSSTKIQSKLKNKGLPLLYCGIARDHAADCFTFLNPKTKKYVESRDVNLWLNQTYGEYEGLSRPSQLSTVVHVPLANYADNLQELENIENMPQPPNVPATNVPPSDASTHSNNNNQADAPPELFSPARTIQYPVAKRMVRELQPHLLDLIEDQETDVTQENENVRVTRSRKGATDLGDAHATMAYLAMCSKYDDFSEFAMVAIKKYDLKVSLTQNQFSTIPQEQYKDYFTVPET